MALNKVINKLPASMKVITCYIAVIFIHKTWVNIAVETRNKDIYRMSTQRSSFFYTNICSTSQKTKQPASLVCFLASTGNWLAVTGPRSCVMRYERGQKRQRFRLKLERSAYWFPVLKFCQKGWSMECNLLHVISIVILIYVVINLNNSQ